MAISKAAGTLSESEETEKREALADLARAAREAGLRTPKLPLSPK